MLYAKDYGLKVNSFYYRLHIKNGKPGWYVRGPDEAGAGSGGGDDVRHVHPDDILVSRQMYPYQI